MEGGQVSGCLPMRAYGQDELTALDFTGAIRLEHRLPLLASNFSDLSSVSLPELWHPARRLSYRQP